MDKEETMPYQLTRESPQEFVQAFNRLASTKGTPIDDVKQDGYFETLGELPIRAVQEAARELQREDSPFLPDAGTWFRLADNFAAKMLDDDAHHLAGQLPPYKAQEDEIARTRTARDMFVRQYEALVGRTLPKTHPWKQQEIRIPTYHCPECRDIGWVEQAGTMDDFQSTGEGVYRLGRCTCFTTNPVLEAKRTHHSARVSTRKR